ncbi:hypothetical protein B0H15DRAFT_951034 [Mycena belliarum]|uniref:Uncharacterized protein n=1 Tax=Mycena belliarum TaxID=1033014 RepID=A0AAD6U049_9AGAR|nr:hypothetical protein B0H15DRAFT_951034 [Mycena belliae]
MDYDDFQELTAALDPSSQRHAARPVFGNTLAYDDWRRSLSNEELETQKAPFLTERNETSCLTPWVARGQEPSAVRHVDAGIHPYCHAYLSVSVLSDQVKEAHRGDQQRSSMMSFIANLVHRRLRALWDVGILFQPSFGGSFYWNVKRKPSRHPLHHPPGRPRRPPHRRREALLCVRVVVPLQGTSSAYKGKSTRIVSSLILGIHSSSLDLACIDDAFLQRATATIPERSVVLREKGGNHSFAKTTKTHYERPGPELDDAFLQRATATIPKRRIVGDVDCACVT